ncbi:TPA: hypothetical protein SMW33_004517 [Pseudomonas aeruginosa]|jgi:hypothetical protein|nr:hypothetical protein [Pseudomonas aeruginosa]HEK3577569.1 hypothetical protein [Pseudomonas aeruginosa]HEK3590458.1 hypothetical protein [Pseudomonas aeruginosa]
MNELERCEEYFRKYNEVYGFLLFKMYTIFDFDVPTLDHCLSVLGSKNIEYSYDKEEMEIYFQHDSLEVDISFDFYGVAHFSFPNAEEWFITIISGAITKGYDVGKVLELMSILSEIRKFKREIYGYKKSQK